MGHRRRRLGLRHRLRRTGPCACLGRTDQDSRHGHRVLLQHRRPDLQSHTALMCRQIFGRRQIDPQKESRPHDDDLWQRLCGFGSSRSQLSADHRRARRGRTLSRPGHSHSLLSVYQPRHTSGTRPLHHRGASCRRGRLLAALSLQP